MRTVVAFLTASSLVACQAGAIDPADNGDAADALVETGSVHTPHDAGQPDDAARAKDGRGADADAARSNLSTGLGGYLIGNQGSYGDPVAIANMGMLDVAILGIYDGWKATNGSTWADVTAAIRAGSLSPTGTRIHGYFDSLEGGLNAYPWVSLYDHMQTNNWWVRSTYPAGTIVNWGEFNLSNVFPGGPTDSDGWSFADYMARHVLDIYESAGIYKTSAYTNTDGHPDGYYSDDFGWQSPAAGDWDRDGVPDTFTAMQNSEFRKGQILVSSDIEGLVGGAERSANVSGYGFAGSATNNAEVLGTLDYGVMENSLGGPTTYEYYGWTTFIEAYPRMAVLFKPTGKGILCHNYVTATGTDATGNTSVDYQAARYGYSLAMVLGQLYYANSGSSGSGYGADPESFLYFDEYAVGTDGVSQPQSTVTAAGLTWRGAVLGSTYGIIKQGPYGIYTREYDHALAIVNPYGNGTQTFTLGGSTTYRRLIGSQAPTVNSGAVVTPTTSITLADRDGLMLQKM